MKSLASKNDRPILLGAILIAIVSCQSAAAVIPGINGQLSDSTRTFNLTAKDGYIATPDGGSYLMWGYSDDDGIDVIQYPGPTLIANEGETVVVNLKNN